MNVIHEMAGAAKFAVILDKHPRQVGYAFRNMANESASDTSKYAKDHFDKNFVERNNFSRRGIQFDKSKGIKIDNAEAAAGARRNRPWLAEQEKGFSSDGAQGTKNVRTSGSYKRSVRRKSYLHGSKIRRRMDTLSKARTVRGKAQAMLAISYRQGYGMAGSNEFVQFGAGELFGNMEPGLYQLIPGSSRGNDGFPRIEMAFRVDNHRRVKATPWLEEAVRAVASPQQQIKKFEKHLEDQLKRFSKK